MRPCSARHSVAIASALATSTLNTSDRSAKVVYVIRRIGRLSDAFDQGWLIARPDERTLHAAFVSRSTVSVAGLCQQGIDTDG